MRHILTSLILGSSLVRMAAADPVFPPEADASHVIAYKGAIRDTHQPVFIGDINGDGRPDPAYTDGTSRKSVVFFNQPDGSFTSSPDLPTTIGTGVRIIGITSNHQVVLKGNRSSPEAVQVVALASWTGQAWNMGPEVVFSIPFDPISLVLADVDGDGIEDLVGIGNQHGQVQRITLVWARGTSQSFTDAAVVTSLEGLSYYPAEPCLAPFRPEPNSPAVIAAHDSLFRLVDGTWQREHFHRYWQAPMAIVPIQFDGDGRQDLLVLEDQWNLAAPLLPNTVTVPYLNTLQGLQRHRPGPLVDGISRLCPIDFDGDGCDELVDNTHLNWYRRDSSGNLVLGGCLDNAQQSRFSCDYLQAVDMDGDGDLDLLPNPSSFHDWTWYENQTPRSQTPAEPAPLPISTPTARPVQKASSQPSATYPASSIQSQPAFAARHLLVTELSGDQTSVVSGDWDGDGDPDLIWNTSGDRVSVCWLDHGRSPQVENLPDSTVIGVVRLADLNLDGHPSLLVSHQSLGNRILSYNHGAWNSGTTLFNLGFFRGTVADLDGDGRPDVLDSTVGTEGGGWYQPAVTSGVVYGPGRRMLPYMVTGALTVADLDGDGSVDLIGNRSWFGRSEASAWVWTEHAIVADGQTLTDVQVVDLDGDGDLDLVGIHTQPTPELRSDLVWFENLGAGTTWARHLVQEGFARMQAADLDGDGRPDLVIITPGPGSTYMGNGFWTWNDPIYSWRQNLGQGTLAESVRLGIQALFQGRVATPLLVDLDGDGDLDLVPRTTSVQTDWLWWENTGNRKPRSVLLRIRPLLPGLELVVPPPAQATPSGADWRIDSPDRSQPIEVQFSLPDAG